MASSSRVPIPTHQSHHLCSRDMAHTRSCAVGAFDALDAFNTRSARRLHKKARSALATQKSPKRAPATQKSPERAGYTKKTEARAGYT